jgi:hypothetical protein
MNTDKCNALYESIDSFIEDERLKIGEEVVTLTIVKSEDTTEVFICLTKDYAKYLEESVDKTKHTC